MKVEQEKYIPEIDGLRAIAVLSVLFFHAGFDQWFSGGYVGVDIFFVISGFLITRLIVDEVQKTKKFSYSNFYYRRCKRLFPALFFVLVISFIFSFLLFSAEHLQRFGGELLYSAVSISNFLFWSESGYFNTDSAFKPLLHTWSLSVEEQFYLLWPITLVFFLKNLSKLKLIFIIIFLSVISFLGNLIMQDGESSFLTRYLPTIATWFKDGQSTIFYLTPFRVFEFGIGALIVWLVATPTRSNWVLEICLVVGLLMLAYSITVFDDRTIFPSYNALIPCIGTALVIYGAKARKAGLLLRHKLSVSMGLISYSVYLCHWPIIVFYKYYKITPITFFEESVIVILSIVIGGLMYLYIEQPFRKHSPKNEGNSKSGFGLVATLLVIAIIIPAATAWANSGWKWRISNSIPTGIAEQLENSKQFHLDNYGGSGFTSSGWVTKHADKDNIDIVMLGDSHIRHYFSGMDPLIGMEEHKNIYTHSTSCLLLPETTRVGAITPCEKTFSAALTSLKNNPHAVILISHYWDFQIINSMNLIDKKMNTSYEDILPKLDKLLSLTKGHKVVIVGNVPGAGFVDVAGCYTRPNYIGVNCEKIFYREEKAIPSVLGNSILKSYASMHENVHYFDPYAAFCVDGYCKALIGEKLMYSDMSHLSKSGGFHFVKYFKDDLLDVINLQ